VTDSLWLPIIDSARAVRFLNEEHCFCIVYSSQHSKNDMQTTAAVIKLPDSRLIPPANESKYVSWNE
jgi:hypothetical protein